MYFFFALIFLFAGSACMFTATFVYGWIIALAIGLPLIGIGLFFIFLGDKENVKRKGGLKLNPSNPLICNNCNRDYDRTWKVCLQCGKQLIEKKLWDFDLSQKIIGGMRWCLNIKEILYILTNSLNKRSGFYCISKWSYRLYYRQAEKVNLTEKWNAPKKTQLR